MAGKNDCFPGFFRQRTGKKLKGLSLILQIVHLPTGRERGSVVAPNIENSKSAGAERIMSLIQVSIPPGIIPTGSAGYIIETLIIRVVDMFKQAH
ncbi:hypothetical protein [Methylomonas sp. MgM2]